MSLQTINVYLEASKPQCLVGTLAYKDKKIYFEYATEFLNRNIELSPYKLPLKAGVFTCQDRVFDGLFGVFGDSLPDGWGKLLLDRHLLKQGIKYKHITAIDRLGYIGNYGIGALVYKPCFNGIEVNFDDIKLDKLANESLQILKDEELQDLSKLLAINGSSAGARPKIMVQINHNNHLVAGNQPLKDGYNHYLVKFASHFDPPNIGKLEYLYSLMARDAKIEIPKTKLLQNKYFAIARFDRNNDTRVHIHSVAGLTHSDFRYPILDYDDLLGLTLHLTKNIADQSKMFRLATFNLFAYNRDDHAKNFSFLLDKHNNWRLAPAYDLTYSQGPGGEHSTTYLGEGKNPTEQHLLDLSAKHNIKNAKQIIVEVKKAINNCHKSAEQLQIICPLL